MSHSEVLLMLNCNDSLNCGFLVFFFEDVFLRFIRFSLLFKMETRIQVAEMEKMNTSQIVNSSHDKECESVCSIFKFRALNTLTVSR